MAVLRRERIDDAPAAGHSKAMVRAARKGGSARAAMARSAMVGIEPLVELLLQIGITSPEAESLLRSVFVHKTREALAQQNAGTAPSDMRVALVSGVHRNFVRQILAEPPKIASARERRGYRAGGLLLAWYTDPAYLDASGKPRDLPERGAAPSFSALVAAHMRGASVASVLQELIRAGVIQSVADHRVRVRSRECNESMGYMDRGSIRLERSSIMHV